MSDKKLEFFRDENERKARSKRVSNPNYPFESHVVSQPAPSVPKTVKVLFLKASRRNISGVDFNFDAGDIATVDEGFVGNSNIAVKCDEIRRPGDVSEDFDYAFTFSNPTAELYIKTFAEHSTMPEPGMLHRFEGDGNQKTKMISGRMLPVSVLFFTDHLRVVPNLWARYLLPNEIHSVKDKQTLINLLNGIAAEGGLKMLNLSVVRFI